MLYIFFALKISTYLILGAGVIGDIAGPSERGGFFGLYGLGPMVSFIWHRYDLKFRRRFQVGPCVGPVIGGVLADKLGWR